MSHVSNFVVLPQMQLGCETTLREALGEAISQVQGAQVIPVRVAQDGFGPKFLEMTVYAFALNHVDVNAVIAAIFSLPWGEPPLVFYADQDDFSWTQAINQSC